ncbi:GNAT family N-acetyltransferase [Rubritalea sp.]|uniref:GNAT family N-acetyltransferase n=1 Tax=Rubritalea sp. TaxID=2109375 RepID=UPI003EF89523
MITYLQITDEILSSLHRVEKLPSVPYRSLGCAQTGWVAYDSGAPVAYAFADRNTGSLNSIVLLPEYRGQGIGEALLNQAEAWLFSHGWDEISAIPNPGSPEQSENLNSEFKSRKWTQSSTHYSKKSSEKTPLNLEEHVISCEATGYSRILRIQRANTDQAHRLCLFLDGEHYWRDMNIVPMLNTMHAKKHIPEMSYVFIGHVSAAARHEDYSCNEKYEKFVCDSVLPWLRKNITGLRTEGSIVCGLSLSGLMATFLSIKHPDCFTYCLSQSGSYWWKSDLLESLLDKHELRNTRFWLSVGDEEIHKNVTHPPTGLIQQISQIEGVEKAVASLQRTGATVRYNQYAGGHSIKPWRAEITEALPWLIQNQSS